MHRRFVQHGPLVLVSDLRKFPTPTIDRDRTVSRRSEPSSRATYVEARQHNYIYGNALEALVGAIYIDKGYDRCREFLVNRVFSTLSDIDVVLRNDKNFKSRILEWAQREHKRIVFNIVHEEQRKDGTFFVTELLVDDVVYGRGEGYSKRESQQGAARAALDSMGL